MFVKEMEREEPAMNIDGPVQQTGLKRSSSAPMINEMAMSTNSPTKTAPVSDLSSSLSSFPNSQRSRRFSSSSSGGAVGLGISPRLTPRVSQLRREECLDVVAGREAAHEREIHSAMQISQSWEDLTFETEGLSFEDSSADTPPGKLERCAVPRQIFEPSPTRSLLGQRHCYSPSFHAGTWKNGSLSPSPTRKAFATRRSLSPIAIRPSCLGGNSSSMKRKFELDESGIADRILQPPVKRFFSLISTSR